MSDELIVSLDEFAELCGVSPETMRSHLREVVKETPAPAWLIERGDRGRAYKIEAEGGVRWWQSKREADEANSASRAQRLQQLRFETIGTAAEAPDMLALSGKQRREEYAAALDAIKYRKAIGQLVERDKVAQVISMRGVELRRRLQQIPPEFAIAAGLETDQTRILADKIERAVADFVDSIGKPNAFAD